MKFQQFVVSYIPFITQKQTHEKDKEKTSFHGLRMRAIYWQLRDPILVFGTECIQAENPTMHACSVTQLCLILCDTLDYRQPGSSLLGILQARILEWVATPSSRVSSPPRDQTHISCVYCIASGFFTH